MKIKRYRGQMRVVYACICMVTYLLISCRSPQSAPTQSLTTHSTIALPTLSVGQSTPQEAIQSYYKAVNEGNSELMAELLDASDESNQRFLEGFKDSLKTDLRFQIENVQIYVIEQNEKWTRIRTNHHQRFYQHGNLIAESESGDEMTLINKGGRWYFIGMGDPIPPGWLLGQP